MTNSKKPVPKTIRSTPKIAHVKKFSASKHANHSFVQSQTYSVVSVTTLLATTIFWSFLSARIHSSNADQLVNSYLFESIGTFQNAILPAAHSFLLKWPIYLFIKLLGFSASSYIILTVLLSVISVGSLVYILYRINRRPEVFGTIMLTIASMLLLVPAQPYAGGILPVNMAMLATRNIEYILFMGSLLALIKSSGYKNRNFWLAVGGLTLLGASDKLFLVFSLGGSVLAMTVYSLAGRWVLARLAFRWLVAAMVAMILAASVLWTINATGLTTISGSNSPYVLAHTLKSYGLGIVFAILGILTNFGANPAFDAAILRNIPGTAASRLLGAGGFSYLTNISMLTAGLYYSVKFYMLSFRKQKKLQTKTDAASKLAILLGFSSIAAIASFIITDHYYVVDARYLSIVPYAVIISAVVYMPIRKLSNYRSITKLAAILGVSIFLGLHSSYQATVEQKQAISETERRNKLVSSALKNHPVGLLVGDYWRTIPIKSLEPTMKVMPLDSCTQARQILSSKNWQSDLGSQSFAYLLSFDKSLTNFPACTKEQIFATYGVPSSTVLISGTVEKPLEIVMFYDNGANKDSATSRHYENTVFPDEISRGKCSYTVMNVVAHQDDDLLFMNPDLLQSINAGHCVRTVYLTAGDSGSDVFYWLARERGSMAAYSKMLNSNSPWIERTIKLSDQLYVAAASPRANDNFTLIFLRLADGSPEGKGYGSSNLESLQQLATAEIATMKAVDKQSNYSLEQVLLVIEKFMQIYRPAEVRTMSPQDHDPEAKEHSDHMATGVLTSKAYYNYQGGKPMPITYYLGYPTRNMPVNIFDADLQQKTDAFLAYGRFDGATCRSEQECNDSGNYGLYLSRQYSEAAHQP